MPRNTTHPDSPPLPPDCTALGATDPRQNGDLIYSTRVRGWRAWMGMTNFNTLAAVQAGGHPQFIAICRPIYSAANLPPPPNGFALLTGPEIITCWDDQIYCIGRGWERNFTIFHYLALDPTMLTAARPIDIPTPPLPAGFSLYTALPEERSIIDRHQVATMDGSWHPITDSLPLSSLAPHPIARRDLPMGDLPFMELTGTPTATHGDLIFDKAYGWMPWVGPIGNDIRDLNLVHGWPLALARLRPEFLSETHQLLGFHTELDSSHEILIKEEDTYVWRPVEEDGPDDGYYAHTRERVLGVRRLCLPGNRLPATQFLSRHLLNILENDPGSDLFRGLIRNELHLVIPRTLHAAGNSAAIREWLEVEYARLHPDRNEEAPGFIRVGPTRRGHERPAPAPSGMVVAEFTFFEDVSGTASVSGTDRYHGSIHIPLDVLRQGREFTEQWMQDYRHDHAYAHTDIEHGDRDYSDESIDGREFNELEDFDYEAVCERAGIIPETDEVDPAPAYLHPTTTTTTNITIETDEI